MRFPFLAIAALLMAVPPAAAQSQPTTVQFQSEAEIARAPDRADFSAGVVTEAATAVEASRQNNARMEQVIAAIRAARVAEKDIQTTRISVSPRYNYQDRKAPQIIGYQATNTVRVRLRDLARAGEVLDALVKSGANSVNGPDFGIENEDAALDEARKAAVAKARARAELYAAAMGMRVKRVVEIIEGGAMRPQPMPMMRMAMADSAAPAPPPVAPGEIPLSVSLSVRFELE